MVYRIAIHVSHILNPTVFRFNTVLNQDELSLRSKIKTMNKAIALAIVATLGCTTFVSAQNGTTTSTTAVPTGKERISLAAIEINATMIVPKGVKAVEETYSYYISGENFVISVESAYDMTLEKLKAEIASNPDKKLISTKAHSVIYKETMMGREMAHFESYVEIDGKLYRFYDKRVTPLTLEQVTPLCEAVETIQPL